MAAILNDWTIDSYHALSEHARLHAEEMTLAKWREIRGNCDWDYDQTEMEAP